MMVSNSVVLGFQMFTACCAFLTAVFFCRRAYTNGTGPVLSNGRRMPQFSGRFELDLTVPVFVNMLGTLTYVGRFCETAGKRYGGPFSQYRFLLYAIIHPLTMYDVLNTVGSPYSLFSTLLTFFVMLLAQIADLAESTRDFWTWFTILILIHVMRQVFVERTIRMYLQKLNSSLHGHQSTGTTARTPMDDKKVFIKVVFAVAPVVMGPLVGVFPLFLERFGVVDRSVTFVALSILDLYGISVRSLLVDQYKQGLRQTLFSYGFLDTTSVLAELDLWDEENDVASQLKARSKRM